MKEKNAIVIEPENVQEKKQEKKPRPYISWSIEKINTHVENYRRCLDAENEEALKQVFTEKIEQLERELKLRSKLKQAQ